MSTRTRREYTDLVDGSFNNGQEWDTALQPSMTQGYATYALSNAFGDITLGTGSTAQTYSEITVWQDGVVSFGAPSQAQITFMSTFHGSQDLSQFPGFYISAGYTDESGQTASDGNGDAGYGVQIATGEVDWVDTGTGSDPYDPADATPVLRIDWSTFDGLGDVAVDKQIVLTASDFTIDDTNYDSQGAGIGIGHVTINGADETIPTVIGFGDNYFGPVATDFFGAGTSDILFQAASGNYLADWEVNGRSVVGGGFIGYAGPQVVGVGDFYGGLTSDILLQDGSGNLDIWKMNGTSYLSFVIGNPGGTWAEKGIGDFNGDGMSDILFQNASGDLAIWEMNGTSIIGGGYIGNPGGTWTEKGVGDFNGDGKSDILFQDASGDFAIWEMNGTSIIGGGYIGNPGGTWVEKGIGDFDGDGKSDILFQDASGDLAIWEMDGTTIAGGGYIGNPGGTWQFASVGDYYGNGQADILFENASHDLAIWEMNGMNIVGGGYVGFAGPDHVLF